ncbi:MAG: hypothetical protein H6Q13_1651 [Bacteroidetes bacterium]|nr:hypothetical protein [Bacteroidota bacterium]
MRINDFYCHFIKNITTFERFLNNIHNEPTIGQQMFI